MNTTYRSNNYEVIEHSFTSMSEFLEYILTQPINKELFTHLESDEVSESKTKFTKTKTFEEAVKLCKFGYFENFDKFYSDKIMLEPYITCDGIGLKNSNDYVGFTPDVKAYLEGNPLNMYNKVPIPKSKVSIYYCIGMSGADNENIIYNRGVITLNIIETLERLGHQVDLHLFDLTKGSRYSSQYFLMKFLMKNKSERLSPQLIYFPMTHPAFNRRLLFRLTEQTFGLEQGYASTYGFCCSLDEMQEVLQLDDTGIIIGWAKDMDVKGRNLIEDAEAMINTINERNKQKTLKMPVFKR